MIESQPMLAETVSLPDTIFTDEMLAELARMAYRFSAEQVHRMTAAGIFAEGENVELIEGLLIEKMTENPPHISGTDRTAALLRQLIPSEWMVRAEHTIQLGNDRPQPDVAVVRGSIDDFEDRQPTVDDLGLLIEVSDSTLRYDRSTKMRIYASASITPYWIINLVDRQIEVYSDPMNSSNYRTRTIYQPEDTIPLFLDGEWVADIPVHRFFRKLASR